MKPNPEAETRILLVNQPAQRLDKFLAESFPEITRSRWQKLIGQGMVLVNQKKARPGQCLQCNDEVHLILPSPESEIPLAQKIAVNVIYEDADIAVVDKPAGMTVHPAAGHSKNTLVNALLARYPSLAHTGSVLRPGIVHRLDRDTSGLVIVAKNDGSWVNLVDQFKSRRVKKVYIALVKGKLEPEQGVIEAPIGRHPANRKKMAVVEGGKEARTRYRVVRYYKGYTLLDIMPETGRTHQIRVHLAAIGFPVIGDSVYGIKWPYLGRQFLHAYKLGFYLPSNGEFREFNAELPQDLKKATERLKLL